MSLFLNPSKKESHEGSHYFHQLLNSGILEQKIMTRVVVMTNRYCMCYNLL